MNNYHYIAIQKAASWKNDANMRTMCVKEFHSIAPADTMDTPDQAIEAAYANGINPSIIEEFTA